MITRDQVLADPMSGARPIFSSSARVIPPTRCVGDAEPAVPLNSCVQARPMPLTTPWSRSASCRRQWRPSALGGPGARDRPDFRARA